VLRFASPCFLTFIGGSDRPGEIRFGPPGRMQALSLQLFQCFSDVTDSFVASGATKTPKFPEWVRPHLVGITYFWTTKMHDDDSWLIH